MIFFNSRTVHTRINILYCPLLFVGNSHRRLSLLHFFPLPIFWLLSKVHFIFFPSSSPFQKFINSFHVFPSEGLFQSFISFDHILFYLPSSFLSHPLFIHFIHFSPIRLNLSCRFQK